MTYGRDFRDGRFVRHHNLLTATQPPITGPIDRGKGRSNTAGKGKGKSKNPNAAIDGTQGSTNAGIVAAVMFTVSGTTPTIVDQKNVASVTRLATGVYRITFTSTLSDANYGIICSGRYSDSTDSQTPLIAANRDTTSGYNSYSTTQLDIAVKLPNSSPTTLNDPEVVAVICFDPASVGSDYLAAATVTVSGTTPTVASQTNVASSARQATGVYTPTYSSAVANSDYSIFGSSRYPDFTSPASPFFGRNRNPTGTLNRQTTALFDASVGTYSTNGGLSNFDPGRFSFLLRNSDVAPRGTVAAVRFSVSGTTCTIVRQWNVSSVSYQAAGQYRVNFTTPINNTDYVALGCGKWPDSAGLNSAPLIGQNKNSAAGYNEYSTTAVDIVSNAFGGAGNVFDSEYVDVWVVKPWLM